MQDVEAQVPWTPQAIAGSALATIATIAETTGTFQFSSVIGRASGLYVNPNRSGHALVLGAAPGLAVVFVSLFWRRAIGAEPAPQHRLDPVTS